MKKRFIAIALISALLCGCAGQTGTNTASNMGGTLSISDFESELESTSSSDTNSSDTSKPAETTTKPTETTKKPAETTTKPAETTTKPAETTTKPAETTTKKPEMTSAPKTTTASTTKPAPEWTETKVSGTKYVNTDCYSRKKAVLGAETVKIYNVNDKVKVIAKTNTGYFKLDTGAFIHGDYLSNSKIVIQTTVATTTKKQETPKPAATTPKPSASADPVDEVHYANNAPAIDEEWLVKKFPEYVRVKDSYAETNVFKEGEDRTWGTGIWVINSLTVGKDIPEGWYLCQSALSYVPADKTTYYTRSNGYTSGDIMGTSHYFQKGDKIYCNGLTSTGEKVKNLAYLLPISNGYTDAGKVYYNGKENGVKFNAVVGRGNKYEPGTYKVNQVKQFEPDWGTWFSYDMIYSTVFNCYYNSSEGATLTLKAGDVIWCNDVKLTKIS